LQDNKVTAIKSYGSNLLDFEAALAYWGMRYTKDGDSFTISQSFGDGYNKPYKFTDDAQVCTISVSSSSTTFAAELRLWFGILKDGKFTRSGSTYFKVGKSTTFTSPSAANAIMWDYGSGAGGAITTIIDEIRINYGSIDCGYQPYHSPATYLIPESLQGTGKGVQGASDTMDFEMSKEITNCTTVVFDGTEPWYRGGTQDGKYRFYALLTPHAVSIPVNVLGYVICNLYDTKTANETYARNEGVSIESDGESVRLYDSRYEDGDISLWKAHLAELYADGNPLTITYAIADPTETDIDTFAFDPLIKVEGGGSLEIITDNGGAVPTSIIYQTII
jgi:hypothetical protein